MEWSGFSGQPIRDDGISGGIHHGTETTDIHPVSDDSAVGGLTNEFEEGSRVVVATSLYRK